MSTFLAAKARPQSQRSHTSYSRHDILRGGALIILVHSVILFNAFFAAVLLPFASGCCTSMLFAFLSVLGTISVRTSSGYNLAMGLFVWPVEVRTFAARIWPSFPLIKSTITASFHFILGISS